MKVDPEWNRFAGLSTSQQLDEIWNLVTKLGPLAGQVLQLEDILGKQFFSNKNFFKILIDENANNSAQIIQRISRIEAECKHQTVDKRYSLV
jgi:hypothetical protein